MNRHRSPPGLFRHCSSLVGVIRRVAMMYARFPLSPGTVEDLLFERGIDLWHETVPRWWTWFIPICAGDVRR